MKQNVNEEGKNHVIKKIRRISVEMDREEFWTRVLVFGLFIIVIVFCLIYYLFT
jgi:hypothetical protein